MRCLNNLFQPLVVQSSTHSRVCNLQFLMSVAGHNFYFAQRQVNINSAPLSPVLGGVLQTLPLTARLISISSKSLWSSMAATSQRYSAVSDRVVLKIRMLAGSLSWALFSKSPFLRKEGERGERLQSLFHIHSVWEKQRSLPSLFKVAFIAWAANSFFSDFKP